MAEREIKRAKATELQRILLQQVYNNLFPLFLLFRLPQLGFHGDVGLVLVTTNVLVRGGAMVRPVTELPVRSALLQ